jgi:hypothetical protein
MSEPITRNGYVIDWLGGYCPVQAEGSVDGHQMYFRARGAQWSLDIGEPYGQEPPLFWHVEEWGTWPDAGYMPDEVAFEMIDKAVEAYRDAKPEKIERGDPRWNRHVIQAWSDDRIGIQAALQCLATTEEELVTMTEGMGLPISSYYEVARDAMARKKRISDRLQQLGVSLEFPEREPQVLALWGRGTISQEEAAEFLHVPGDKIPAKARLMGIPAPRSAG